MVILAIMLSLGITSYGSANKTRRIKQTIELAQTYAEAIDQFALDHGGRVPDFTNPDDWHPTKEYGPVSRLSKNGPAAPAGLDPYIRKATVMKQYVGTGSSFITDIVGTDGTGADNRGHLVYLTTSTTTYELKVYVNRKYVCSLGNDTAAITPPTCQ